MASNQRIIITGGSSGLGLGLAKHYAQAGKSVAIIARDPAKLEAARNTLQRLNPRAVVIHQSCDVTDTTASKEAIAAIVQQFGGLDLLINSAGVLKEGYFEGIALDTFKKVMDVNLFGIINVCHAALPHLKQSRGQIVNIASMAALTGVFGYTPYCASKHALAGFTESLRYEMKPHGVTVQLVCPPEFDSPLVDELNKNRTPENRAHTLLIPKQTLEAIVNAGVKAIDSKRYMTTTGVQASSTALVSRFFPGLTRMIADRAIARAIKNKQ